MNDGRRKELNRAIDDAQKLRALLETAKQALDDVKEAASDLAEVIGEIRGEEQDYFDNMPESLQGGDKGAPSEAAVDLLDEAKGLLDDLDEMDLDDLLDIDDLISKLDDAKNQ